MISVVALSVLVTCAFKGTRGSVLAAALIHWTFKTCSVWPVERPATGIRSGLRVDNGRGLVYCAQFCALCARICALTGDQSILLDDRRSHSTNAPETLLPQRFRCLVALPSDIRLF